MGDTVKMLLYTDTLEVSGVKRAANRKKFAITKSEISMSVVNAVIATPVEGEEQFVATLKSAGADAKRIEAATAMFRLRSGFADVLKPEDIGVLAKAHKEPNGDEQGDDESDEEYKARKAKKSKNAEHQTGIDTNFKPVHKSADLPPETKAQLEAMFKSNEMLAKQVKDLTEQRELTEYTAKAEREFAHVPGSSVELAKTLKAAHDAGPEAEKVILVSLSATNEMAQKSELFQDMGSTGGGLAASAHQKIQQLVNNLTMKSADGKEMTAAQKYTYVISETAEGRELYRQYNAEQDQRIKNR